MTAWLAVAKAVPLHLVAFYAAGVLCFLSVAINQLIKGYRENSLKYKFFLSNWMITSFARDPANKGELQIDSVFLVMNNSPWPIFAKLEDARLHMQGRVNPDARPADNLMIFAPNCPHAITCPSLQNLLHEKPIGGKGEVRFRYGMKPDKLNHTYHAKIAISVGVAPDDEGKLVVTSAYYLEDVRYE